MNKHPANNGKVMLMIWVDAPLRDYVRARAMESKQPVSRWAADALRRAEGDTSLGEFAFGPLDSRGSAQVANVFAHLLGAFDRISHINNPQRRIATQPP